MSPRSRLSKKLLNAATEAAEENFSIEIKGRVLAGKLNVRKKPKLGSKVVGVVRRDDILDILNELPEWYEIKVNNTIAYVYKKYVRIFAYTQRGEVTAKTLNIRKLPSVESPIVGKVKKGQTLLIISELPKWYAIDFNGHVAYVYKTYILAHKLAVLGGLDAINKFFNQRKDLMNYPLEPQKKLTLPSVKNNQYIAAKTWNSFGNLMSKISEELAIEVEAAMSVLCVESHGNGFSPDGRMIIRFENHIFWMLWGKYHPDTFNKYFKFNRSKTRFGHYFRTDPHGEWKEVHKSQQTEWETLEFAKTLDEEKALKSMSMGAPQVMGFNHKVVGYSSVFEMFEKFNKDIRYQIFALFDFTKARPRRVKYLQDKDFFSFAREYNGTAAPAQYEKRLLTYYHIFKKLL